MKKSPHLSLSKRFRDEAEACAELLLEKYLSLTDRDLTNLDLDGRFRLSVSRTHLSLWLKAPDGRMISCTISGDVLGDIYCKGGRHFERSLHLENDEAFKRAVLEVFTACHKRHRESEKVRQVAELWRVVEQEASDTGFGREHFLRSVMHEIRSRWAGKKCWDAKTIQPAWKEVPPGELTWLRQWLEEFRQPQTQALYALRMT